MGNFRDRLAAIRADGSLTVAQRQQAVRRNRAYAVHEAMPAIPFTFARGDLIITVVEGEYMPMVAGVQFTLEAVSAGVFVVLDNPFVFINPPTHVADPAGDTVKVNPRDNTETRFREDPAAALLEMIVDAVKAQV